MRRIDLLLKLQDLDSEADTGRTTAARLSKAIGDRQALDAGQAELDEIRQRLREAEAAQRDLELLAEDRRSKISNDEGKLYSGKVFNPKELASLADEVEQDKRQLSTVEDRLIEAIAQVEDLSGRAVTLGRTLQQEETSWTESQRRATTQLAEVQGRLGAIEGERKTMFAQLAPREQVTYEQLRRGKGSAVARVHQSTCQSCRVALTPSQERRARLGNELIPCHSCGRILFVPLA
jgi:hypothetical protein